MLKKKINDLKKKIYMKKKMYTQKHMNKKCMKKNE